MRLRIGLIGMSLLLFIAVLRAQKSADDLFQQGTSLEAKGDNPGAIKIYERIVKEFASTNHSLAANATIHLARLSDVQGQEAARRYYQTILDKYPEQTRSVAEARKWIKDHTNTRIEITTPYSRDPWSFAISPNGKSLVFLVTNGGTSSLWLRRLDSDKQGPIPGTESSHYGGGGTGANPFWSPDGRFIAYFDDQKLKTISVAGGSPKILAPAPSNTGGSWNATGDIVFAPNLLDSLSRVSDKGEEAAVQLTKLDSATRAHRFPRFLPDERHFLIYMRPQDLSATGFITIGSLDGEMEKLPLSASAAAVAPPNRLVFASGGELQFQEFDVRTMKLTGSPVVLDERVATYQGNSGVAAFSVSKEGPIAYRKSIASKRRVVWRDAMGKETSIGNQALMTYLSGTPRFSPNGQEVSFARNDQAGFTYILNAISGQFKSLEVGRGVLSGESPIWSPDGTSFLIAVLQGATYQLFQQGTSATPSSHTRIWNSEEHNFPTDWWNEFLLFNRTSLTTRRDVMVLPAHSGSEPIPIAATDAQEANGRFSRDGKWIVYESDELGGRNEIFVQPFPGTAKDRLRLSNSGGTMAQWSWDGTSIYFLSEDNHLMAAGFKASPNGKDPVIEKPVSLFSVPAGTTYAPAPDGRFLMSEPTEELPPIIVQTNPFGSRP